MTYCSKSIEHDLQAGCVRWFRAQYSRFALNLFAVPNGQRRSRYEQREKKQEGLTAGVADMILLVPSTKHHGLCIEFKREKTDTTRRTYQEPEQKLWQQAVEAQGYRYEVVRTFEQFYDIVTDYMRE
jgi:hypothetical protein